jgi:hypothetical protein
MKNKVALFTTIISSIFVLSAACGQSKDGSSTTWTKQEVDNVFDLSELGVLSQDTSGKPLFGGKYLNPEFLTGQAYGRNYNLLRLDDDVLNSLSEQARDFYINASSGELRVTLRELGLSPSEFRNKLQVNSDKVTLKD